MHLVIFSSKIIFLDSNFCSLKADIGPCRYFQQKWYWDNEYKQCRPFNYGGCLGNFNRFSTLKSCWHKCGDYSNFNLIPYQLGIFCILTIFF